MDDALVQRLVEAGARAILLRAITVGGREEASLTFDDYKARYPTLWRECCKDARACLSAAHALAEQEGVIFTRVPEEVDISGGGHGDGYKLRTKMGWNNCRAATLAGKVTL